MICFEFPSTEILNTIDGFGSDQGMKKSLGSQWKLMPRLSLGCMPTIILWHNSVVPFPHNLAWFFFLINVFDILNFHPGGTAFLDREVRCWHMSWDRWFVQLCHFQWTTAHWMGTLHVARVFEHFQLCHGAAIWRIHQKWSGNDQCLFRTSIPSMLHIPSAFYISLSLHLSLVSCHRMMLRCPVV